jgi:hypothetical protein
MPRFLVVTIIHENHYVEADSEEEACDIACQRDAPDSVAVSERWAEILDDAE